MNMKRIELFISNEQAWELAQFCKRLGYSDIRKFATDDDQADVMMSSILILQKSLSEFGYSPR